MGSTYQSIELLSKEKGIETQIVLDAVKDALLVAARKHYRTNENYIAELNEKTRRLIGARLDELAFEEAWGQGRALSLDAVALAFDALGVR